MGSLGKSESSGWMLSACLELAAGSSPNLPCSPPALFSLVSFSFSKLEPELGPMLRHRFTAFALEPHAKAKRRKFTRTAARKSALNGCGHCTCLESLVFVKCFESPGGWVQAKSQRVFLGLQNTPWWLVDTAASEDTGSIYTRRMTAARTNMK